MAALDRVKVLVLGDSGECVPPSPPSARCARAQRGAGVPPPLPCPPPAAGAHAQ